MDRLVSTLQHGAFDSITIELLQEAFNQLDANDVNTLQKLKSHDLHVKLMQAMTALFIINYHSKNRICELISLQAQLQKFTEFRHLMRQNHSLASIMKDLTMKDDEIFRATVPSLSLLNIKDEQIAKKIVGLALTSPSSSTVLASLPVLDMLSLDCRQKMVMFAISSLDSAMDSALLFSLMSVVIKCRMEIDSQVQVIYVYVF